MFNRGSLVAPPWLVRLQAQEVVAEGTESEQVSGGPHVPESEVWLRLDVVFDSGHRKNYIESPPN